MLLERPFRCMVPWKMPFQPLLRYTVRLKCHLNDCWDPLLLSAFQETTENRSVQTQESSDEVHQVLASTPRPSRTSRQPQWWATGAGDGSALTCGMRLHHAVMLHEESHVWQDHRLCRRCSCLNVEFEDECCHPRTTDKLRVVSPGQRSARSACTPVQLFWNSLWRTGDEWRYIS